jgi:hypothetical protein
MDRRNNKGFNSKFLRRYMAKCAEVRTCHEEQVTIDFAFATVCRFDLLGGKYLPKRIFG